MTHIKSFTNIQIFTEISPFEADCIVARIPVDAVVTQPNKYNNNNNRKNNRSERRDSVKRERERNEGMLDRRVGGDADTNDRRRGIRGLRSRFVPS